MANSAPIMAPILTPATRSIITPAAVSSSSTPMWEKARAPPQVRGRKLFIDGSLVDNLPVKAMADMGEGPIIAVDVKATPKRPENRPVKARGRDDRLLQPPRLGQTLGRLLLLGSENTTHAARRYADLVIRPHAEGVGLLEFASLDTAREAGRAAARQALERASASLVA